ncbi:hypothetical protein [Streptomyces radicis]|uniref:Uncharacterized protein n=1 Tax=Streptomyces radicis TaxID=1750517 RepID=A0A3A9WAB2_9ACTN|nr:hypothetical protein [Streptomyces radicis]RKN10058.1 hypothetical protein D7319_09765 [Streptomyces radicis]RKN24400.1 hypothetical protein D7318_10945 [Streptomyces radicis]
MTSPQPRYVFEQVQIGKGLRPLAQHGFIVIDDQGVLSLLGTERQPIDSSPLARIAASKIRFTGGKSVSLTLGNGNKYNVSPGWGARGAFVLPGDTGQVRTAAEALIKLIAASGGKA